MSASKIALVTGGTSGIGKAAAIGLAAAGWSVTICGRRAELVAETARAHGMAGEVCDITINGQELGEGCPASIAIGLARPAHWRGCWVSARTSAP